MKALASASTRFRLNELGQGLTEYLVVILPIALVVLSGVRIFDTSLKCKYELVTVQFASNQQLSQECASLVQAGLDGDASDAGSTAESAQAVSPATPLSPPEPPIPPGTDPLRHHVGDGLCSGPACGGNLAIEGLQFNKTFAVNLPAIESAGIQFVRISLLESGITFLPTNGAHVGNSVSLNGQVIGTLVEGFNEFLVPVSALEDLNTITIQSASIGNPNNLNFDDFEFFDLSVTFA